MWAGCALRARLATLFNRGWLRLRAFALAVADRAVGLGIWMWQRARRFANFIADGYTAAYIACWIFLGLRGLPVLSGSLRRHVARQLYGRWPWRIFRRDLPTIRSWLTPVGFSVIPVALVIGP